MGKARRNYSFATQKTKISAGDKLDDLVIKVAPKNPQETVPKFG